MADVIKRLKYYNGQFLQEPDFTAEQEYHLDRQRRHNRQLHTPGIAHGLTVTVQTNSVVVAPGTAIDDQGRQIVLHEPRTVGFEDPLNGKWVLVVISYEQVESDVATVGEVGDRGPTRFTEVPKIEAVPDDNNAPSPGERIRLARLQLDAGGAIVDQNMSVRTPAGARLRPEETLERLKLSRQGVPDNQWPTLISGAANRADVLGDLNVTGNASAASLNVTGNASAAGLNVTGNIVVTGMVDGRDISADAAANQAHHNNTNNPHGVTAAQVGAIASVAGMTNAGGNIGVTGSQGITVTTNVGTKTVNIAGGSPTQIAGISNPGGNIPINGSGGISVAAGGGAINISTSAAAIGALPAGDYLKRSLTYVSFNPNDADWATRTISPGFAPKLIWVNGKAWAQLTQPSPIEEGYYGGVTGGLCRVSGPGSFTHYGVASHIRRFPITTIFGNIPTWSMHQYYVSGVGGFYCADRYSNPQRRVSLRVYVSSLGAESFVLTFRRDHEGYAQPFYYFLELDILTLG